MESHKKEIKLFFIQNFIYIIQISETHFTTKTYFSVPRYKLSHTGHPDGTARGGTAILIKGTIVKYELLKYGEDSIQATSINVQGFPYEINVTAVYSPHQHNQNREHFEAFFRRQVPIFIAGNDYNSKHTLWGSRLATTKGGINQR